jgi:hypothetical protein
LENVKDYYLDKGIPTPNMKDLRAQFVTLEKERKRNLTLEREGPQEESH